MVTRNEMSSRHLYLCSSPRGMLRRARAVHLHHVRHVYQICTLFLFPTSAKINLRAPPLHVRHHGPTWHSSYGSPELTQSLSHAFTRALRSRMNATAPSQCLPSKLTPRRESSQGSLREGRCIPRYRTSGIVCSISYDRIRHK